MKKVLSLTFLLISVATIVLTVLRLPAAEPTTFQTYEYATIRWGGRENTHVIRPNGQVEMLGPLLKGIVRPDRTDERSYYMSISMNAVAKEGFEFAGMTHDEIVMKRALPH
jgi:hypothetical protein